MLENLSALDLALSGVKSLRDTENQTPKGTLYGFRLNVVTLMYFIVLHLF